MCAFSLYKLHEAQTFNSALVQQERALLFHTVVTTLAHMIKCVQQYDPATALTTFLPPMLLLVTSSVVRRENQGVAACLNVFMTLLLRIADNFIPEIIHSGFAFNLPIYGSHCFSLSHTVGKVLIIATRFTAICFPLSLRNFWTPRRVKISSILMFAVPALSYAFILSNEPAFRFQSATRDISGPRRLGLIRFPNFCILNFENKYLQLMKLISSVGYFLFFVISTPMCAACVYNLRLAQKYNVR
ncbi:hypothetical protein PFISCL1PPCAC_3311 [Pristionchus fissidentatus]|uniref:G protein-coupled receptor n=1 Tax=Pristionchus fissidentatus TaxID=1538716 RepID=A0AAV5V0A0_9BILA|nr:hypothetical protein PFISCL1PPCAC_3311 [Pristionchus fissidentatus]